MPLHCLKPGESRCILHITGKDELRIRLAALGLVPGERVTVLSTRGEDLIVQVKNSRLALGQDVSKRIIV